MALIKCIECGNRISSFAASCPHCGCPAEMQAEILTNVHESTTDGTNGTSIKESEKWDNVLELVKNKEIIPAIDEIKVLIGENSLAEAMEIFNRIKNDEKIPIDFIVQKYPALSPKPEPTMAPCTACSRPISVKAEACPHCGQPTGVHVCPRCGSTDWVYIDAVSKVGAMALFGAFAVNTVRSKYQCKACKFKY